MKNTLTVVSGCPRSGTSLMMDLMRVTFGDDRILGEKFPQEPKPFEQDEGESDEAWALRQYEERLHGVHKSMVERARKARDMNPNGFWETNWVHGIPTHPLAEAEVKKQAKKKMIVKVVSQGLARSNVKYIGKVIYMLRHPRCVAKSQERLLGRFGGTGNPVADNKEVRIHSPAMFVRVSQAAARILLEKKMDYHVVVFDDLIADPQRVLTEVAEFLNDGNFSEAIKQIDPTLKRSYPKDGEENPLWPAAEEIYEKFASGDLQGVLDVEVPERGDREQHYECHRMGRMVTANECNLCRTHKQTRHNFIAARGARWAKHPCTYEVMTQSVSIEDSITNGNQEAEAEGVDTNCPDCRITTEES